MSGQLQNLLKRAAEARAEKQQRERARKFFEWLEDAFGVNKYEKEDAYGKPAAIIDSFLIFVCNNFDAPSATVYAKCEVCRDVHNVGIVRSPDELAERLNLDEQGNLPAFCAQSFFYDEPQTAVHRLLSSEAKTAN